MYTLLRHALTGRGFRIFIISALCFTALNLFENSIHYIIGRTAAGDGGAERRGLPIPSSKDLAKILVVMAVFSLLQGFLTMRLMQQSSFAM